ncbi:hypothetical protein ACG3SL_20870 [Sphingomonas sp. CJ20]
MFLALALMAAAPAALPAADVAPQRHARRYRPIRAKLSRKTALSRLSMTPRCTGAACDPANRYRLAIAPEMQLTRKERAAQTDWKACGVTGMPVCPSRGRTLVKTPLGED